MSEHGGRNLNHAANVAFGLLVLAVMIFGAMQAQRFINESLANWPLSYEGTPEADVEMAANNARAGRALTLLAIDGAVGWAGVCAFAALKRISGLAWTAAIITLIFLVLAGAAGTA